MSRRVGSRVLGGHLLPFVVVSVLLSALHPAAQPNPSHALDVTLTSYNTSRVSGGIGFDKCQPLSISQMATWWSQSPFFDVGVYFGGVNFVCTVPTSTWVSTIIGQGWNIIPIWNGPHPPCGTGTKFSSSTPHADGVDQANLANTKLQNHGIVPNPGANSPPVVYYDLENYDPNNSSCVSATNQFITGWDQRLHNLGYKAGVYASACSGVDALWNTQPDEPDQLYVGDPLDPHPDVWGLTPSQCTDAGVPNAHWNDNGDRRLHQYQTNVTRNYGGVSALVDFDCQDGRTVPNKDNLDYYQSFTSDDESIAGPTEDAQCPGPYP